MTEPARDYEIKQPHGLTPRIQRLRDFYFEGMDRSWNNEYTCWTTGTPWDVIFEESDYHIVPETFAFMPAFTASALQAARSVEPPPGLWQWSIAKRRAWLIREVMVERVPKDLLPGDLLAGGRFNLLASACLTQKETKHRAKLLARARRGVKWFHEHGYGNVGAASGHLIPDHARALDQGWKGIHADLERRYAALPAAEKESARGQQLEAMMIAATMPRDLAAKYEQLCRRLAATERDPVRERELSQMADNLTRVPWEPAQTFWEAVQALWLNHMLIMSDECYPGPGVSFGRFDQLLYPYWQRSLAAGEERDFLKEILGCFWIHANTAYDAMIRIGNQGITSGFGQLLTLSGLGPGGTDLTNDLTYAVLEVIDEMSPILEPKPNVRLHRSSPEKLLDEVVAMIATSQGAHFLLNFDERSMAGMLRQAKRAGVEELINAGNVHDYAPVGCLENTMVGNDRSGTVDCNLNLLKAVELALAGGRDLIPARDLVLGTESPIRQDGPVTGDATRFTTWEQLWQAYATQTRFIIERSVDLYEHSEAMRAAYGPTPYLSCLVRGCAQKGLDITQGGAELNFVTIEAVTFASTVDSLLAIKNMVFDEHKCTMAELIQALRDNWKGHEALQAWARFRAPKYGRDDDEADAMARAVMDLWSEQTWSHRTRSTGRQFRPGMLSWNYWVAYGYIMAASADGRPQGEFLSNAICPVSGTDIEGPTANTNSVGKAFGGFADGGQGDFEDYLSALPNGASHTITFNPALLADPEHRAKLKAFLKGYARNGGSALQINILDTEMLRDAQAHPEHYRHLLVRVTGYNAYFTAIGRELQNELIARESHRGI